MKRKIGLKMQWDIKAEALRSDGTAREIKFRAYHKNEQRVFDVADIIFYEEIVCELRTENAGMMGLEYEHLVEYDLDNVILMQFTGLQSKHGNDIYEGDILQYTYNYKPDMNHIAVVTYNAPKFTCMVHDDYEIIGNVYENPDLLCEHEYITIDNEVVNGATICVKCHHLSQGE